MRITRPKLRALVACLAGAGLLAAGASATEPVGEQFRVSAQGPDGNASFDARAPHVAHNPDKNEYLVVWHGVTGTVGEFEIYGRLHQADGTPLGAPFRISTMGPDGDPNHDATHPAATYNPTTKEYYVVWQGSDLNVTPGGIGTLTDGEFEIHGQRLTDAGVQIGEDDKRLSDMGPDGNVRHDALRPDVAYNSAANEYFVAWSGNDVTAGTGGGFFVTNGEQEIFRQRVSADGAEIGSETAITNIGPVGNESYDALQPAVAYNAVSDEYLVAFTANVNSPGSREIHAQRVNGTGTPVGSEAFLVSDVGPDDSSAHRGETPTVVHNTSANQYLVAWSDNRTDQVPFGGKYQVHAQILTADGAETGPDDFQVSDHTPGDDLFDGRNPSAAYSTATNEYLIAWEGMEDVAGKTEAHAQRINPAGAQIGPDDVKLSSSGPADDAAFDARSVAAAYNATSNEFLVAWSGTTNVAPLIAGEEEIYARRIKGAAAPGEPPPGTPPGGGIPGTAGAPSAPNCAEVTTITGGGSSGQLSLTTTQLRINQKIGQAAVRRANAIDDWLNDGLVNGDLCGGSLVPGDLDPGVSYTQGLLQEIPSQADPRPLAIPPATPKPGVTFQLTTDQLKINQAVYSAAVRRANALKARIEGELTGGDITDGQLTADRLRQDLDLGAVAPAAQVAAASQTNVAPPQSKNATFTLTLEQLRINQRVAQAAVKRTNELRALLGSGLKGENFADGTISGADWAP